ncbi:ROK family protein [Planococcus shenhongbingii]|uniref:ROK family protein n=1 Tax=Planococcus shenhongbingii TaxID=3058398 RepID=A0ABT8NFH4_9BACL|nr:ROK family protein [Planococcus sp. N017]MDN7246518.1 ROK family protein [Planococcus sp. N017]
MNNVLGVDIGGTKIRLAIVGQQGTLSFDETVPTKIPLYPYLEEQILRIIKHHPEVNAIGIGTHGFVDSINGKVIYATDILPGWTGTDLKKQLEAATGKRVEVDNDANCAALAEAKIGAARGNSRVVCLTLGTGLGGGIIWDGKLLSGGPHGGAAEIGHMVLYPNGVLCPCGRRGCYEQYVSGTALNRRIKEAGLTISSHELFEVAATNPHAMQLVKEFTADLAQGISSLQAIFDMEVVVIGGGVSEAAPLWWDQFMQQLEPLLLNPLSVKVAEFGNEAGVLGAALLLEGTELR